MDEAEKICLDVINQNGSDTNILGLLGAILLKKDEPDKAIKYLKKAIKIVPGFAQAHEDLGSAYFYTNQVVLAITHLEKALQIDPGLESASNKLSYIFKYTGRQGEADELIKKLFSFSPEKRRLLEALEHLQKKEFRKAEKIAKEAVKTNPNNVDALRLLAIIANETECHNDAEKLLKRVVELKPLHMDAWHDLSGALGEQNKLPGLDVRAAPCGRR